ncbi:hypothetical protein MHYP_G00133790 [Metynnis hypsauchen]
MKGPGLPHQKLHSSRAAGSTEEDSVRPGNVTPSDSSAGRLRSRAADSTLSRAQRRPRSLRDPLNQCLWLQCISATKIINYGLLLLYNADKSAACRPRKCNLSRVSPALAHLMVANDDVEGHRRCSPSPQPLFAFTNT